MNTIKILDCKLNYNQHITNIEYHTFYIIHYNTFYLLKYNYAHYYYWSINDEIWIKDNNLKSAYKHLFLELYLNKEYLLE